MKAHIRKTSLKLFDAPSIVHQTVVAPLILRRCDVCKFAFKVDDFFHLCGYPIIDRDIQIMGHNFHNVTDVLVIGVHLVSISRVIHVIVPGTRAKSQRAFVNLKIDLAFQFRVYNNGPCLCVFLKDFTVRILALVFLASA